MKSQSQYHEYFEPYMVQSSTILFILIRLSWYFPPSDKTHTSASCPHPANLLPPPRTVLPPPHLVCSATDTLKSPVWGIKKSSLENGPFWFACVHGFAALKFVNKNPPAHRHPHGGLTPLGAPYKKTGCWNHRMCHTYIKTLKNVHPEALSVCARSCVHSLIALFIQAVKTFLFSY